MNRPLVLSILLASSLVAAEPSTAKPEATKPPKENSAAAQCIANARTLSAALVNYAMKHKGKLPADLETLNKDGTLREPIKTFTSPFDPKKDACGYELLVPGKSYQATVIPARTPLLRARFADENNVRTVGFMDGHVERIKENGQ